MAELRTEEEQVEALKRWWQTNGKSLLLTVALALALVMGWKAWQQRQEAAAANASVVYQNLLEAVSGVLGAQSSPELVSTAEQLASTLKSDYGDSAYARLGALLMSRVAVEQGQLDQALSELDWVLAQEPEGPQRVVAQIRKARLLAEQGNTGDALALLDTVQPGEFESSYQELRGDLLLRDGREADAREAYRLAIQAAEAGGARPLLKMKLDNLAVEEG
ncbi:YfgM family protein [Marinobacterium aestuariivivens]|uniref:Ancillary SecYEG translocon subunit n=1 Tax=Marinobacterium aestuariivivens TaxID=1698799 RepID=A0ABW2A2E4_9GAMM